MLARFPIHRRNDRRRDASPTAAGIATAAGVTILEMLIAMAVSLLVILAVVQGFQVMSTTITESRAVLQMAGRTRTSLNQLRTDLAGVTVKLVPPLVSPEGYVELFEGRRTDMDADGDGVIDIVALNNGVDDNGDGNIDEIGEVLTHFGDTDDILMFTSERVDEPFLGRVPRVDLTTGNVYSSEESSTLAEIAWWTSFEDRNENGNVDAYESFLLHRRALLIRPDLNVSTTGLVDIKISPTYATPELAYAALRDFQRLYDVSARVEVSKLDPALYGIACNTLGDLSRRGSRFAHLAGPFTNVPMTSVVFPHVRRTNPLDLIPDTNAQKGSRLSEDVRLEDRFQGTTLQSGRLNLYAGEDVVTSGVLAFDVRVYDPNAPVKEFAAFPTIEAMSPGDPGWSHPAATTIGTGAYVDLAYNTWRTGALAYMPIQGSVFSGLPAFADLDNNFLLSAGDYYAGVIPLSPRQFAYYDTWTTSVESDGFDQDVGLRPNNPGPDQGTDGLDNDGANGADDSFERETSPPYPTPLRGIEVRIRVIDPDSRQIRQVSLHMEFVQ